MSRVRVFKAFNKGSLPDAFVSKGDAEQLSIQGARYFGRNNASLRLTPRQTERINDQVAAVQPGEADSEFYIDRKEAQMLSFKKEARWWDMNTIILSERMKPREPDFNPGGRSQGKALGASAKAGAAVMHRYITAKPSTPAREAIDVWRFKSPSTKVPPECLENAHTWELRFNIGKERGRLFTQYPPNQKEI